MSDLNCRFKNIVFEESYFEEEYRDDFLVSTPTKKIWATEMDLLCELLRVCKKHDIQVFAFAGTLLGAIRHKGFIPWDDDMDVCLDRENFEKLLCVADEEFKAPYFFQTALNDRKYFFGYARLRNSQTTGIIKWNNSIDYNNGIFIDVFVMDSFTHNPFALKWQLFRKSISTKLLNAYYSDLDNETGMRKLAISLLQNTLFKFVRYERLYKHFVSVMRMYEGKTDKVTLLTQSKYFREKYWFKTIDLRESIDVPFENIMIPIPKHFDEMLRHMYGNYMDFPPVEQRGKWHDDTIIFDPDVPYKEYMAQHRSEQNPS